MNGKPLVFRGQTKLSKTNLMQMTDMYGDKGSPYLRPLAPWKKPPDTLLEYESKYCPTLIKSKGLSMYISLWATPPIAN